MKPRLVAFTLVACFQCPFCTHDNGDGESPWEFDYCSKLGEEKGDLENIGTIPDFCPLPEA